MIQRIRKVQTFINFLLDDNNTFNQKKGVLKLTTSKQLLALCEIFYNILQGVIDLSKKDLPYFIKKKNILGRIVNKKKSIKEKKNLLIKNTKAIILSLEKIRGYLKKNVL